MCIADVGIGKCIDSLTPNINFLAVFVSAIIGMAIGALWYSPILFGNVWMKVSGIDKSAIEKSKKSGMWKLYLTAFIGTLVMSFVLAYFVSNMSEVVFLSFSVGAKTGFLTWLGFIAPILLGKVLWESKPFKLYLIEVSQYLVALVVIGGILAAWR